MATSIGSPKRRPTSARACGELPEMAVVLGSGLGDFAGTLEDAVSLTYADIPHWPASRSSATRAGWSSGASRRPRVCGAGGPRAFLRGPRPAHGDVRGARARAARREDAAPHQRRRRHQHVVRAGRADADDRSHQPDGQQSADRPERGALRRALSGHERGLFDAAARAGARGGASARASGSSRASTSRCTAPSYETPAEIRLSARSAPTRWACRRCPKRSSRGTWGSRCSASRASPTWRRACCRSRSSTTR